MGTDHPPVAGWWPSTDEEKSAVLQQAERIAASPGFRSSKNYPAMLRGVVTLALDGKLAHLKERSLGIEIFGRDPDYDTSDDPVVRVVAAEVRKRIGRYYAEASASHELVIDLPSGSYVPRFRLPSPDSVLPVAAAPEDPSHYAPDPTVAPVERGWQSLRNWPSRRLALLSAVVLLLGSVAIFWLRQASSGPTDRLWGPLIESREPMLILIGGALRPPSELASRGAADLDPAATIGEYQLRDSLTLGEATALSLVTNTLGRHGKAYLVQRARSIDLSLLRAGPVVVIGGFNNPWTRRLTAGLRFTFAQDSASQTTWIEDAKNKQAREWKAVDTVPYRSATDDFAIVARLRSSATEHPVLVIAGLKVWGTLAAGEFVSNPAYLAALAKRAPAGWKGLNLEAVIRTRVINGVSGPPQLMAVEFW
jgi:hypothetical protein